MTMENIRNLEKQNTLITSLIQGERWQVKNQKSDYRLVFPILFDKDDFKTNKPLGGHKDNKDIVKVGGVYIVIPCFPPNILLKTENIFVFLLYNSLDEKLFPLAEIFAPAIQELRFLEDEGISIETKSGPKELFFSLAGLTGDNLAVHSI